MYSVASCVAVLLFLVTRANAAESVWTYEDQAAWENLPDSFCNGSRQSPIDIPTSELVDGGILGLTTLVMTNWNVPTSGDWLNNGHTVQYTPANVLATTETYLGVYNLIQLHFHWGPNAQVGSEHLVGGSQYSGELHFVHQKATSPANLGNTYTVVGVLLVENSMMDLTGTVWEKFATNIPPYKNTSTIDEIVFNDMLPTNLSYYYYNGSLTTPPCTEAVQWALLSNPLNVPAEFFSNLRETQENSAGNVYLEENYRETQSLNGRQVYQYSAEPSPAAAPTSTAFLLLLVAMIAFAFIQ